ncbi:MAG: hypothetical protein JXB07_00505 [Anaerolineae bacterium]|nr:hypothetical protein [Anaerolineae bacterium]
MRGYPVVWDGRDDQGNLVPLGDYQLLFYTANHAGLFGAYSAAFRVVDALPVGGIAPTAAPLAPIEPPDDALYSGLRCDNAEGATIITYPSYDNAGNLKDLKSTTFY